MKFIIGLLVIISSKLLQLPSEVLLKLSAERWRRLLSHNETHISTIDCTTENNIIDLYKDLTVTLVYFLL